MDKFLLDPYYNIRVDASLILPRGRKYEKKVEEHKNDVQLKKGLWESCNGEIFINLKGCNLITFFWQDYKDYNNLVYIYLNNNELKEIDGEMFFAFPNLYWLDLRNNQLISFPKEVKNHPKLDTILLDNNNITDIPIELGSLPELKGLSIFDNPIKLPKKELLELRQSELINYLRKCWQVQTCEVPLNEPPQENKKFLKISKKKPFKRVEEVGEFVSRNWKSRDPVDQILADTLVKNIEGQNDILQKRKDADCLKEWRERYTASKSVPIIKTIHPPPYGTFEQFSKMPNRKDIKASLNVKQRPKLPKPKRKRHEYLVAELKKIQDTMDKIRSAPIPTEVDEKSINEAMAARLEDIKALRDIQKRINELRCKT